MSQRDFFQFLVDINNDNDTSFLEYDSKSIALILFEACKLARELENELSKIDSYKSWYQIVKYQSSHPLSTVMALRRQDQFVHEKRRVLVKNLNDTIDTIGSIMIHRKNGLPINVCDIKIDGSILKNGKPWWIRHETAILKSLMIFGGIFAFRRNIGIFNYENLTKILENAYMTIVNYVNIWILVPISEIWNTIGYSRDISELTHRTSTLKEDIQTLNEMIADYTTVNAMKTIMEAYKENIKAPIRNLFRGDLLRLLLIQVQQAKVELETAMTALDKLLKSNKLNFELLALIPAVGLFWLAIDGAWGIWKWILGRSSRHIMSKLRDNICEFEAHLDSTEENIHVEGCKTLLIFKMFTNLQGLNCINFMRNDLASLAMHKPLDQRWIIYRMNKKLLDFKALKIPR